MIRASEANAMSREAVPDVVRPYLNVIEEGIKTAAKQGHTALRFSLSMFPVSQTPPGHQMKFIVDALKAHDYEVECFEPDVQHASENEPTWTVRW